MNCSLGADILYSFFIVFFYRFFFVVTLLLFKNMESTSFLVLNIYIAK